MRVGKGLVLFLFIFSVSAEDSSLERRTAALAHELRCLVCQNQTLAESNAPLAVDLRNQVREQLAAGKSEDEVKAWLVARYGDFVLYRPPFKAATLLLWLGPFLLLALGTFFLLKRIRRKTATAELNRVIGDEAALTASLKAFNIF